MAFFRRVLCVALFILCGTSSSLEAAPERVPDGPPLQSTTFTVTVKNVMPVTSRFHVTLEFQNPISTSSNYKLSVTNNRAPQGNNVSEPVDISSIPYTFGSGKGKGDVRFYQDNSATGELEVKVNAEGLVLNQKNEYECGFAGSGTPSSSQKTWKIKITYPSSNSISGHHFTSYRALSKDACGVRRRRSQDSGVTTMNLPGTSKGPHPLDLVMVLDKSGSMTSKVGGAGSDSKIQALSDAAQSTISQWQMLAGSASNENDRLGVVFFETQEDPVMFGNTFFVERGGTPNWDIFTNNGPLDRVVQNAGGSTAMGDGMREGFRQANIKFAGGGGGSKTTRDLAMIVMTDGRQNEGHLVRKCKTSNNLSGKTLIDNCGDRKLQALLPFTASNATARTPIRALTDRRTLIQTFYVGPNSSATANLMDGIATQNGGNASYGVNMTGNFATSLVDILSGSSPRIVLNKRDVHSSDMGPQSYTFLVNQTAQQLIATLDWKGHRAEAALDLDLIGPNGNVVSPSSIESEDGFTVLSYDFSGQSTLSGQPTLSGQSMSGSWKARIQRGEADGEVPYEFVLMAEDASFSSRVGFRDVHHYTGDDLFLEVRLLADGKPLTGIDGLRVTPSTPAEGLGNLMHERSEFQKPNLPRDQISDPYSRKLYGLFQNPEFRKLIRPQPQDSSLRPSDDGESNGARKPNDGIYTIRIPDVQIPGEYNFDVVLKQKKTGIGPLQHTAHVNTIVEVKPTLSASKKEVSATDGGSRLRITPLDKYGNYLGPGYGRTFSIRSAEGEPLDMEIRNESVNGTYEVFLPNVSPDSDRPLQISVGSVTFTETTMADLRGGLAWPMIILIAIGGLLVLALLVYLFANRRRHT